MLQIMAATMVLALGIPQPPRTVKGRYRIETAFIDPGKPWQNGTDESFNGKFRNECLTLEWFRNRVEAKVGVERWRRHYNEERPHMSLGDRTPAEFKSQIKSQSGWLGEAQTSAILQ
jgi:transposase InsO family protein